MTSSTGAPGSSVMTSAPRDRASSRAWTSRSYAARLMMLVHHDDAAREYAYGAKSPIGTFSEASDPLIRPFIE